MSLLGFFSGKKNTPKPWLNRCLERLFNYHLRDLC